jgi:CheY-like chemotaxis protein
MISPALTKLGAEVVGPAPDLEHATALLATGERIDSAVLDINLPGELVYPVADALRQRGIPFLFATGYDQASIPAGYEDVPRRKKPFDHNALARVLPALMQG